MSRTVRSSVLLSVFAVLALSPLSVALADHVAMADGVVVDSARGMAYLSGRGGGMNAVELGSGTVLWTTSAAAKPLAVSGDLVVAQAESADTLELVSFQAASGAPGAIAASVDLPPGVEAKLSDGPKGSFRTSASLDRGVLLVSWVATQFADGKTMRGYLPAAEEGTSQLAVGPAAKSASGAVALDLASGAISEAATAAPVVETMAAGDIAGVAGNQFLSADGRHVLASERQATDNPFQSYRWTIYARDTGTQVGQTDSISSAAPFVVADGTLFFVAPRSVSRQGDEMVDHPRRLAAIDLASGEELWSQEALDPNFRGPFPP